MDRIDEYRLFFIRIEGSKLYVQAGTIATYGGMKLLKNENDKLSLGFNGQDQYLKVGNKDDNPCLYHPDSCSLGISISFTIKFNSLKDNSYIYTNCGDHPDSTGYAIYYRDERMYFKISTKDREWTVYVTDLETNRYYDIMMSWSIQFGVNVYVDFKRAVASTDYLWRDVPNPKDCDLFVGNPNGDGRYGDMVLENWHILLASREILIAVGFVIGE